MADASIMSLYRGKFDMQREVKEHQILMSTLMVQANLNDLKTNTRRLIKVPRWAEPGSLEIDEDSVQAISRTSGCLADVPCPYGEVGDRLWVREAFIADPPRNGEWDDKCGEFKLADIPEQYRKPEHVLYRADPKWAGVAQDWVWSPSIHMPRWACRELLEITGVSHERLQDISEEDAIAEGVQRNASLVDGSWSPEDGWLKYPLEKYLEDFPAFTARESFQTLFESINGPEAWERNDWVWRIEYKRLKP